MHIIEGKGGIGKDRDIPINDKTLVTYYKII